jgi:membrane associated rhomboid family serine protease
MDWSLVLASQGIEHRIDHDETTGWSLTVSAAAHSAALAHIRQYRVENRYWRWRRPVFQPGLFFDWTSLLWVLWIVIFHLWSRHHDLHGPGMMTGGALNAGEWWRLFTAVWLHADLAHLAMNAVFGFLFLGLVMGSYGPGVGMLAAYLAGASGNLVGGWVHGPALHGLGSSGMVMGALGLIACPPLILPKGRRTIAFRLLGGGLVACVLIFMLVGVDPKADVVAHLGGFAAGWLLGALLAVNPRLARPPLANVAAGVVFVLLIIVPWILALRHR